MFINTNVDTVSKKDIIDIVIVMKYGFQQSPGQH